MNDLGFTPPPRKPSVGGATPVTIVSEEEAERKPSYPSLSLNGPQAKAAGLTKCAHGDEYEMTVRLRAKRIGGYDFMSSGGQEDSAPAMEFDVLSADAPKKVESEESDAEQAGESEESEPKRTSVQKGIKSPRDLDKKAYAKA